MFNKEMWYTFGFPGKWTMRRKLMAGLFWSSLEISTHRREKTKQDWTEEEVAL
jgi:hypothetical protein